MLAYLCRVIWMLMEITSELTVYELWGIALLVVLFLAIVVYSWRNTHIVCRRRKLLAESADEATLLPPLSVILVVQKGGEVLSETVRALMSQDYPDYEVIAVNADMKGPASDDLLRLSLEFPALRTTFVPEDVCNVSVRKLAITLGVKAARNEVVVITSSNCVPPGSRWLRAMGRHFGESADMVLGYTRPDYEADHALGRRSRCYDEVTDAVCYLAAAMRNRPYRGKGTNIAYRKRLFYENKGFSASLNLKYGDDDLFVEEMAARGSVSVEYSPESILRERDADFAAHCRMESVYRAFTAKLQHSKRRFAACVADTCYYLFLMLSAFAFGYAALLFLSVGNACLKPYLLGGLAVVLYAFQSIQAVCAYRSCAKLLQAPALLFTIPVLRFFRPFRKIYYSLRSCSADNYTWE